MPRVSRAEAQAHRQQITEASARLFKERGFRGVSVADLMGAAGLTHGGFYGHFESKDALAGAAVARAFEQSAGRWRRRVASKPANRERRTLLVERFLAHASVAEVGLGCPAVSLATDVAREPAGAPLRQAYVEGLAGLVDILAGVQDGTDATARRSAALADFATMAGALLLARASAGTALADDVLTAARARLVGAPGPSAAPAPVRPRTAGASTPRPGA